MGSPKVRWSHHLQADGFLWMAHSFSTLSSLKDELEIGALAEKKGAPDGSVALGG